VPLHLAQSCSLALSFCDSNKMAGGKDCHVVRIKTISVNSLFGTVLHDDTKFVKNAFQMLLSCTDVLLCF
jgi:hypothetical protein